MAAPADRAAYRVQSVKALAKLPDAAEASKLLQRLVQATQALLIRKKWRVLLLSEFLPKTPGLLGLNVNRGAKIMIRLREPHNHSVFLPWESLLGTMVHELVHIEISSHSYEFYRMVDVLCDEVQDDMNGRPPPWTDAAGHRLGGGSSSVAVSARELAASAALKRSKTAAGEPQRLGGRAADAAVLTKQELMARAAERRAQDNGACGDSITAEDDEELVRNTQEVDLTDVDLCLPCRPPHDATTAVVELLTPLPQSSRTSPVAIEVSPAPVSAQSSGGKRPIEVIDLTF